MSIKADAPRCSGLSYDNAALQHALATYYPSNFSLMRLELTGTYSLATTTASACGIFFQCFCLIFCLMHLLVDSAKVDLDKVLNRFQAEITVQYLPLHVDVCPVLLRYL